MNKFFFLILLFLIFSVIPFTVIAQGTTPAQGITAAKAQEAADAADAVQQEKKAVADAAAGNKSAATIDSDQAQVDDADVKLQQAYVSDDTLRGQGAGAANIATADAAVNAAAAFVQERKAILAADQGNASAAAQAATSAKTDATAANGNAVAAGGTGVATGGAGASSNFVPLTNLPIFGSNITSAPALPAFLNNLYIYCVGIAAVLAVVQIMRAGILYMGGDSVTETRQAKSLIGFSVLGLVLVLSPVIVFNIINPKILNLDVGFKDLTPTATTATAGTAATTPNTANGTVAPGGACTTDTNCQDTATQTYGCYPEGNGKCTLNGDAVLPIPAATTP